MADLTVPHLGPMGINSPGYGPRAGTKEAKEADEWTKQYWDAMFKGRETNSSGINSRVANNG